MAKRKNKQIAEKSKFEQVADNVLDFIMLDNGDMYLPHVEFVLYHNYLIDDFLEIESTYTGPHLEELISHAFIKLEPIQRSRFMRWLFKERIITQLAKGDNKQKHKLDDDFISVLKEYIWVAYYIRLKNPGRIRMMGSTMERLNRLLGIYLAGPSDEVAYVPSKDKYIINIVSLKNAKYGFLPYPDHIDPSDLESLALDNGVDSLAIRSIIRSTVTVQYTAYERHHIFKFLRDLVLEKIMEGKDEHPKLH